MNKDFYQYGLIIVALMAAVMIAGNAGIAIAQTSSGASGGPAAGASSSATTSGSAVNVTGRVNGTLNPVGISDAVTPGNDMTSSDMTGHVSGAMVEGKAVKADAGAKTSAGAWPSESQYWKSEFPKRSYYTPSSDYTNYEPAYQYGYTTYQQNPGKRFDELDQLQLRSKWEASRGKSTLTWDQAQAASRDAYTRMSERRVNSSGTVQ